MDREDEEIRDKLKNIEQIPFRAELKNRILQAAKDEQLREVPPTEQGNPRWRRRGRFTRYASVVGALAAAFVLVAIAIHRPNVEQKLLQKSSASTSVTFNPNATQFGLKKAPLKVTNVRIGTAGTDPLNADVIAELTNTSKQPIAKKDLFGVLSFTPVTKPDGPENWLTFVNGPDQTIQPGQTVQWVFHPTGQALHGSNGEQLVEQPHLHFYSSKLSRLKEATTVWTRSALTVDNVQVEPRTIVGNMQSVQLDVSLTNSTKSPVDLGNTRAVIWFASDSSQSFLSDKSIRFLYHVTPEEADQHWPSVVQPGQTVQVNFRVLSDVHSDFFSRTPHIVIVNDAKGEVS